jgi:hypothetical protein
LLDPDFKDMLSALSAANVDFVSGQSRSAKRQRIFDEVQSGRIVIDPTGVSTGWLGCDKRTNSDYHVNVVVVDIASSTVDFPDT